MNWYEKVKGNTMKKLITLIMLLLFVSPCFSQTTGGAGNANVWNFPGGFQVNGAQSLMHLYGHIGFADSSQILDMTQNVHAVITNEGDSLFHTHTNRGLLMLGDSVQVPITGDYMVMWDLSFAGQNTDSYHITIFVENVEQSGMGEAFRDPSINDNGTASGHAIFACTAGDWITLRIKNTANGNDATVVAGNLMVAGKFVN